MALSVGDRAPDFTIENHRREPVRLSDFFGRRRVVLAFHPLAWTPVCADQMGSYQAAIDRLEALNASVLGVSVDSTATKAAWARELGLTFDLLSDFWPHGEVARQYGVFNEEAGIAERTVFVIDTTGRIVYVRCYDMPARPDLDEVVARLESLARTVHEGPA